MFKQEVVLKFLFQVFLNNLKVAFKEGIFFDLLYWIIPQILEKFRPKKHCRLSSILETPVIIGSPYFKALEIATISLNWYKTLV